jgi:signal peptidase I
MRESACNAERVLQESKAFMTSPGSKPANNGNLENRLKCELVRETLRMCGIVRLRVTGLSMIPALWPGDVLVFERCGPHEILMRDIVFYMREGAVVAHRMLALKSSEGGLQIFTKGEALAETDPPVAAEEVLGRLKEIIRGGKTLTAASTLRFPKRLASALAKHSTLATRLLAHLYVTRGNSRAGTVLWET